ncbi:hypothetical protein P168DRAFT_339830 [Aspergillus campestris IBT 28561]|uniref:Rogdi leucine zipper containing protein-domain-containing protein n=1 Tax=Aspergillus campestris (strain IBT 28561) TaxID=1392248 RepID=A0A2I1D9N3_ASPC2|nr:uncharacterized protein P168DRAFT_339830 [Aspergillus campestris IBT 28561]PKY06585.1 hypothetical protein P168DRAFT_339830 [Aspergillus campestris IBT 28561]
MATWAYPPLPPAQIEQEADSALDRELEWLLRALQDSLTSLREGLQDCASLLAPKEPGSTLVISSVRSENVKGFVTRVGTKIVKGDIQLRLSSLASARGSTTRLCLSNAPTAPELVLDQLVSVRNLVNQSLDVVDVSAWTGDPLNPSFIFGQLRLLHETISEARQMLKGESEHTKSDWCNGSAPEDMFDPPLPSYLSFHLAIVDSALVLCLRTLESTSPTHTASAFATDISLTGFNIRDRLFGSRNRTHDEAGEFFAWKGDEVRVRERIRIESQDPSLMAVMAKLTALEHEVMKWTTALKVLMGNEDTDSDEQPLDRWTGRWKIGARSLSTDAPAEVESRPDRKDAIYALIDQINSNEVVLAEMMDELDLLDDFSGVLNLEGPELDDVFSQTIGHRDEQTLEARVQVARQDFGDFLPEGHLNAREIQLYTRLYGEPIIREQETELELLEVEESPDKLFREDGQGGWEEIEMEEESVLEEEAPVVYDMDFPPPADETAAMQRTREVAEQLGGHVMLEEFQDEAVPDATPRLHPLTAEGKFSPDPSTVFPPKESMTGPISIILSEFSNKHIADVAHRTFGGPRLPNSTATLPARAQLPQLPIALDATQRYMGEMEANVYLATLYPGMYASILSTLVEVRKRLGSEWIRRLMSQEGGPNVLDASAGGAGILAWRDVLRAEWELMVPDHPPSNPIPVGRSTVVTGSDSLRMRASAMLENTTFLPRLPDYVNTRGKPTLEDERAPKRKQFDIIVAPHSIMGIEEEYVRKQHVENLWNLLNPNGGVLILLEKGHQKGFEAVAGAREMLLKRHIASPGSTRYEDLTESPGEQTHVDKEPGMIIAPCTNHSKCPMFHMSGHAKGRQDFCHFEQRYIRPDFLQRIIGAKDRNHEDVKFSYLAVQRGVDLREVKGIVQGPQATEAAFEGYETPTTSPNENEREGLEKGQEFNTLSLPRLVYPPMKRRGHVTFDVCTPAAKIERWTVPRSFSRRAYKDARKSQWGDLWALGAKTRIPRSLRLGDKRGEGKKERLARRAAEQAEMNGLEETEEGADVPVLDKTSPAWADPEPPRKKKGQKVAPWKKQAEHRSYRKALRNNARKHLAESESG